MKVVLKLCTVLTSAGREGDGSDLRPFLFTLGESHSNR